jgi:hypothetical protein
MDFKALRNRIERINLHPDSEWEIIKNEPGYFWHFKNTVFPLTGFVALATFVGNLFIMRIYDYSFAYVLVKSFVSFIISFFCMFVPALMINELNELFSIEKNSHKVFKLFIYSFTAFWVASIIAGIMANYNTLGKFIKLLGIYGVFPYWVGVSKVFGMNDNLKVRYVLVSLFIVLAVYILLNWSLGFFVKVVYYTTLAH